MIRPKPKAYTSAELTFTIEDAAKLQDLIFRDPVIMEPFCEAVERAIMESRVDKG